MANVSNAFKISIADTQFSTRVLEPESMEETAEDYAGMDFHESNLSFIKFMSPMIPLQSKVVDFGCGPGDLTILLARERPDLSITGVDLSHPMLEIATKNAAENGISINWRIGDMTQPIFPEGSVDFIFSHTSLHHLKDPVLFFKQMKRALRPNGGFCIRDLRRPETAVEAMTLIYEATQDHLTQRQYELFFYSLRASLTIAEVSDALQAAGIAGTLEIPKNPNRYWVLSQRSQAVS